MDKISITIDVGKITKEKIISRQYTSNTAGELVTVKELKLDIIPLKEPKHIRDGDNWSMWKTHFVAEQQTNGEKENKVKSKIIGDGIIFRKKDENKVDMPKQPIEEITPSDIPF